MTDKYKTVHKNTIGEGFYSEKRSKFLAFVHHIDSADEALTIVKQYKKKYYDARHCCYAYRLGAEGADFVLMTMENLLLLQVNLFLGNSLVTKLPIL